MGKTKKKHPKKPEVHPADRRPWQVTTLSVLTGLGGLLYLYLWFFYRNVVGGNSLPVGAEALPLYRTILLVVAFLSILLAVLHFLGVKAAFWIQAVVLSLGLIQKLFSLDLFGILLHALYLYLLFCESSRIYFRIGQFKALGPRKK